MHSRRLSPGEMLPNASFVRRRNGCPGSAMSRSARTNPRAQTKSTFSQASRHGEPQPMWGDGSSRAVPLQRIQPWRHRVCSPIFWIPEFGKWSNASSVPSVVPTRVPPSGALGWGLAAVLSCTGSKTERPRRGSIERLENFPRRVRRSGRAAQWVEDAEQASREMATLVSLLAN